jgi:hypothetical protein
VPTGRNAGDAIGSVPAQQAPAFEANRAALQPHAEAHVLEVVIPAMKELENHVAWRPGGVDAMSPKAQQLWGELVDEVRRLPGEIVADLSGTMNMNIAGTMARIKLDELVKETYIGQPGSRSQNAVAAMRRALGQRALTDGTSGRVMQS